MKKKKNGKLKNHIAFRGILQSVDRGREFAAITKFVSEKSG